jgi:glycosyltransferase involved in cell wall biosynthesis
MIIRVFKWNKNWRRAEDFIFGYICAAYCFFTSNRAIVYSYYAEGFVAFYKNIKKRPDHLVIFQVHPAPWYINNILRNDSNLHGVKFSSELEIEYSYKDYHMYFQALSFADKIIAASSFTVKAIESFAPMRTKKFVVPYGSRFEIQEENNRNRQTQTKIKLLSVGQLVQRKGFYHAFEAMKGLEDMFEW